MWDRVAVARQLLTAVGVRCSSMADELYQLAITGLGIWSWLYFSYNVTVVFDGEQTTYALTGLTHRGRDRFFSREVFLSVSVAMDILLRVFSARRPWRVGIHGMLVSLGLGCLTMSCVPVTDLGFILRACGCHHVFLCGVLPATQRVWDVERLDCVLHVLVFRAFACLAAAKMHPGT